MLQQSSLFPDFAPPSLLADSPLWSFPPGAGLGAGAGDGAPIDVGSPAAGQPAAAPAAAPSATGLGLDPEPRATAAPSRAFDGDDAWMGAPKTQLWTMGTPMRATRLGNLGYPLANGTEQSDATRTIESSIQMVCGYDPVAIGQRQTAEALFSKLAGAESLVRGGVGAEVAANTNKDTSTAAQFMDVRGDVSEVMKSEVEGIQEKCDDAAEDLADADAELDVATDRRAANQLRRGAAAAAEQTDAVRELCGAALEGMVGAVEAGPAGLLKPAYDAITTIIGVFSEDKDAERANELEGSADDKAIAKAHRKIVSAQSKLRRAKEQARRALAKLATLQAKYGESRSRAEGSYDATTKGDFKFAPVAEKATIARSAEQFAEMAISSANATVAAATSLLTAGPAAAPPLGDESFATAATIQQDHEKGAARAQEISQQAGTLAIELGGMQSIGDQTMVDTEVPARGGRN